MAVLVLDYTDSAAVVLAAALLSEILGAGYSDSLSIAAGRILLNALLRLSEHASQLIGLQVTLIPLVSIVLK